MNVHCDICDAVLPARGRGERCAECGARPDFQTPTLEPLRRPRHAVDVTRAWEFSPDGPVLRRVR